jgi:hypothetical protein
LAEPLLVDLDPPKLAQGHEVGDLPRAEVARLFVVPAGWMLVPQPPVRFHDLVLWIISDLSTGA